MRLIARLCFAVGVAAVAVGVGIALAPLVDASWAQRPLFRTSIELGEEASSHWLRTDVSTMRAGLKVTIMPRFVTQEMRSAGDGKQVGLYRFPFHYRVRDQSGNMLIDQWVLIDAAENRTLSQNYTESLDLAPITVDAVFDPFPLQSAKHARIEALLLPDRLYSADIEQAELRLFRQPQLVMGSIRLGLAAIFGGMVLMLLSLFAELALAVAAAAEWPVVQPSATRVLVFRSRSRPQPVLAPVSVARRQAL